MGKSNQGHEEESSGRRQLPGRLVEARGSEAVTKWAMIRSVMVEGVVVQSVVVVTVSERTTTNVMREAEKSGRELKVDSESDAVRCWSMTCVSVVGTM